MVHLEGRLSDVHGTPAETLDIPELALWGRCPGHVETDTPCLVVND